MPIGHLQKVDLPTSNRKSRGINVSNSSHLILITREGVVRELVLCASKLITDMYEKLMDEFDTLEDYDGYKKYNRACP
jgi:hypothetical protein